MDNENSYGSSSTPGTSNSSNANSISFTTSYSESQAPSTLGSSTTQIFQLQQQLSFVIGGNMYLFPSIFGVYRNGMNRFVLSENRTTTPFMSIATHSGLSSEPSVVVSSPTAVMGTAQFHSSTSRTDIVVGITSTSLQSTGILSPVWNFTYTFDDGHQEAFEWKKSSGEAVAGLGGKSKGHKLVRVLSGEIVAAWTHSENFNLDNFAKIGLLDSARVQGWGERWEVTVVIAAVALIEKERRARDDAANAA
ncbi:hypothetical protein DSL72_006194 [Monilinia vaccinii-corymbosi]|uniref:Uncharacterized protein n=1 Tax=Monilinia vaccinii-corymbosi TaxID=61207 RepID=A0A8A3PHQ5_9HELO|nr:hypothetical protein DSL72_006194 [Monilinia vaccinii-corymbosi]